MSQGVRAIPTEEEFAELCEQHGGNVSAIAQKLGVTRRTVTRWIAENEAFAPILDDARDASLDLAEDRMMMLINGIPIKDEEDKIIRWQDRPDAGLIKFKLATQGKKRGYGESVAVSNPDGTALATPIIQIINPNG